MTRPFTVRLGRCLSIAALLASACAHTPPTGAPPTTPAAASVPSADLTGEVFSEHRRRPFLRVAVDGRCYYSRRYRNGEAVAEYIREMSDAVRRRFPADDSFVLPVDLDCFAAIGRSEADRQDAHAAFVTTARQWLEGDPELEALDLRALASRLRLEEARALRFGDPLVFLAYEAYRRGHRACSSELLFEASRYGLHEAWSRVEMELDMEGATAVSEDEPVAPSACLPVF